MNNPVKKVRQHLLLTQQQMAERLNVSRQMISSYESGRSSPRMDVIRLVLAIAIRHKIDVVVDDFFI